jgi:hypothetical protein
MLDRVATTLDRNNAWDLAITGGQIYLTINGALFEGSIEPVPLP